MRGRIVGLATAGVLLMALQASALEIVIGAAAVEPRVLTVKTGERVDFRNVAPGFVHLEFGDDPLRHQVVQGPIGAPTWAVFHRRGTHPYVVHVVEGSQRRTLNGVVAVIEDATHRWDSQTCGVVVMGECLEP